MHSLRNCFASHSMDRLHSRRRDEEWFANRIQSPSAGFLPMWQSRNLVTNGGETPRPVILSALDLGGLTALASSVVLLGEEEERPCFAVDLPGDNPLIPEMLSPFGHFQDLRRVGVLLDARGSALLAYARAITTWHHRSRFCGDCGTPTVSAEAGHMRICTNERCRQQHFPRTDPAIIVLVASGEECLLGRQSVWPELMYSVIAGFVEPGESLEAAVVREVGEETGVRVGTVRYHSSQPWPFPSSIMLGFTAQAATREIRLGDDELEDARWFTRQDLRDALHAGSLKLPTKISIAYRLIEDWYDAGGDGRLSELIA